MDIDVVWRAFCAAHEGRPAADSAVFGMVHLSRVEPNVVAAGLLKDTRRHRVPLPLDLMVGLRPPLKACVLCQGTGAEHVAGGTASLCRCVGGEYARTWVVCDDAS